MRYGIFGGAKTSNTTASAGGYPAPPTPLVLPSPPLEKLYSQYQSGTTQAKTHLLLTYVKLFEKVLANPNDRQRLLDAPEALMKIAIISHEHYAALGQSGILENNPTLQDLYDKWAPKVQTSPVRYVG